LQFHGPLEHEPNPGDCLLRGATFFVTGPGQTDVRFILVAISLVLIVDGFGVLYSKVQAWLDRLAKGANNVQLQIVGILGLLSLLTLNNAFWVAALLLAAIRTPDFVTPLWANSRELAKRSAARN